MELKKRFEEIVNNYDWNTDLPIIDTLTGLMQSAYDLDRWVSVDVELPDFETPVLVYTADGYIQNAWLVVNTDLWRGIGQWKFPKVTHWQPLPKPTISK